VTREETDQDGKFWTGSIEREPMKAASELLVGFDKFWFVRRIHAIFGDTINYGTGAVGAGGGIVVVHAKLVK
jgi:hypothetical protein